VFTELLGRFSRSAAVASSTNTSSVQEDGRFCNESMRVLELLRAKHISDVQEFRTPTKKDLSVAPTRFGLCERELWHLTLPPTLIQLH
jgi:hypothetical protein